MLTELWEYILYCVLALPPIIKEFPDEKDNQ
ncbi:hypothetical protein EcWSU1_02997 [Enterobacter ludwigii]|uniref:Uncharacterized protein n=1 Tax=Enterobacter ludwigii TaxID=299767 RepID=G8LIY4_9ENTR|nr:hypothetical protein EcWSU1_02997 [Enterobacter ludwigii]